MTKHNLFISHIVFWIAMKSPAKKRGSEINVEYAEAFVLIREIC